MFQYFRLIISVIFTIFNAHILLAGTDSSGVTVQRFSDRIEITIVDRTLVFDIDATSGKKTLRGYELADGKKFSADYIAYSPDKRLFGWNKEDKAQPRKNSHWYILHPDGVDSELPFAPERAGFLRFSYNYETDKIYTYSIERGDFLIRYKFTKDSIVTERLFVLENNLKTNQIQCFLYSDQKRTSAFFDIKELSPVHGTKIYDWVRTNWKGKLKDVPKDQYVRLPQAYFTNFKKLNEYIQFGYSTKDGETWVSTINKELKLVSVQKGAVYTHVMPEVWDEYFDNYESKAAEKNSNGYIRSKKFDLPSGRKPRAASHYARRFLIALPERPDLFVPLAEDGKLVSLSPDIIGVMPMYTMDMQEISNNNASARKDSFMLTFNWLTAIKDGEELRWGWASGEFNHITPALWQDIDFYSEGDDLVRKGNFRKTEKIEFGYFGGARSIRMVEGLMPVGQLLDGRWQLYVQPNGLNTKANLDMPNNYSGEIPTGASYEEAVEKGIAWLYGYQKSYTAELKEYIKIYSQMAKNDTYRNEFLEKREAEHKAYLNKVAADKARAEASRRYTTSASYKGIEPSFTNKLRNMSATGSSQRATRNLQNVVNQMNRASGKGYKTP